MANQHVTGAQSVRTRLAKLRVSLSGVVSTDAVQAFMVRRVKSRLTRGVTPENQPFTPLAVSTVLRKKSMANRGLISASDITKPLLRTRTMLNAITVVRRNAAASMNTMMGFSVGVDPNSPAAAYARLMNKGGKIGRRTIPARPFLGVSNLDVRAFAGLLARETAKLVRKV